MNAEVLIALPKIMRENKLKAQIGYKRRYIKRGKTAKIADNILQRDFNPDAPNKSWVSDITYVKTYEGFLYVAMVLDLFSRRVIGWSMGKTIDRHLVIDAMLMAKIRHQPKEKVLFHSDQGSQYGSHDCVSFMSENNLIPSMSRRGNCHHNAVAESFLLRLKSVLREEKYSRQEKKQNQKFLT